MNTRRRQCYKDGGGFASNEGDIRDSAQQLLKNLPTGSNWKRPKVCFPVLTYKTVCVCV